MNDYSIKMNIMLSKNSMLIIGFLLKNPTKMYNVNQISKELDISIGSAHKIAKELFSKGIIKSEKQGNNIFYKLDMKNKETRKICEIFLIEDKNRKLSQNKTAKIYSNELENFPAKAVVLFGSVLTKPEKSNDVDVLFVIKNKKDVEKVSDFCLKLSKLKTRPIVPLIMAETDMTEKLKEKNPVVLGIIKTGVVLSGEEAIIGVLSNV